MRLRLRSREGGDRAARETQILGWILVAPAMVAVAALVLYPLIHGFKQSIRSGGFLFGEQPGYVGTRNYRDVLNDQTSRDAMRHTVEYVLLAVSLELVLGIFVAVTLHRVFRGRGLVLAILILPWALPSVVSRRPLAARLRPRQRPPEQRAPAASRHQPAARVARERAGRDRLSSRSSTSGASCRWSA